MAFGSPPGPLHSPGADAPLPQSSAFRSPQLRNFSEAVSLGDDDRYAFVREEVDEVGSWLPGEK
jgi:hypothetical protein